MAESRATSSSTFTPFPRLCWELRNQIWENSLPSIKDPPPSLVNLIRGLCHHILELHSHKSIHRMRYHPPRIDHAFYLVILKRLRTHGPSPLEALDTCTESRIVALEFVRDLIKGHHEMFRWFCYVPSGFWWPKLDIIRQKKGQLVYSCGKLKESWSFENLIFWDVDKERKLLAENGNAYKGARIGPIATSTPIIDTKLTELSDEKENENEHGSRKPDSTNSTCSLIGKKRKQEGKAEDEPNSRRRRTAAPSS